MHFGEAQVAWVQLGEVPAPMEAALVRLVVVRVLLEAAKMAEALQVGGSAGVVAVQGLKYYRCCP